MQFGYVDSSLVELNTVVDTQSLVKCGILVNCFQNKHATYFQQHAEYLDKCYFCVPRPQ
jgi:hypothetical protein